MSELWPRAVYLSGARRARGLAPKSKDSFHGKEDEPHAPRHYKRAILYNAALIRVLAIGAVATAEVDTAIAAPANGVRHALLNVRIVLVRIIIRVSLHSEEKLWMLSCVRVFVDVVDVI